MAFHGFEYGLQERGACFSPCGRYRWTLFRRWGPELPLVVCMLNPSTADDVDNDPTVTRCERRARDLGRGGLIVVNLFGLRSTDPEALKRTATPIGPHNDAAIRWAAFMGDGVVCAWGVHGSHLGRDWQVRRMLRDVPLWAFAFTKRGNPSHPLYLPYEAPGGQRPRLLPFNQLAKQAAAQTDAE